MGKAGDFVVGEGCVWVPEPLCSTLSIIATLRNQTQIRIQRNPHCSIKRNLKCSSHVLCPHSGHKLLGLYHLNHFSHQHFPIVHLRLSGTLLRKHFLTFLQDGVFVVEDLFYFGFVHNEPFLNTRLSRPSIPMSLPFKEDDLGITGTIPSKPVGDGPWSFVQTAVVEFQLIIIKIHTIRQLRITLPRTSLLQKHRQMLQNSILDLRNILGTYPILGSTS
mmetsp:Transcript_25277/g.43174  ORF Transcript_25277/g.43174 Transcript_25277/m.43174 type:complete len:219 (-) Transcript_25277:311-967(-)